MLLPFSDDAPRRRTPVVTYALIMTNLLVFLYSLSLSPTEQQELAFVRGFLPARVGYLQQNEVLEIHVNELEQEAFWQPAVMVQHQYVFEPIASQVWLTLLSCMFLHGGFMHLASNMWLLWIFGDNVEDRLGHVGYLIFYLAGGLAATGLHYWSDPVSMVPIIGASGAIAAVLGAYAVTWPWASVYSLVFVVIFFTVVRLPALLILGGWFVIQLIESGRATDPTLGGGVAWWAHIGGFIAGALLMPLVRNNPPPPLERREDGYEYEMMNAE